MNGAKKREFKHLLKEQWSGYHFAMKESGESERIASYPSLQGRRK